MNHPLGTRSEARAMRASAFRPLIAVVCLLLLAGLSGCKPRQFTVEVDVPVFRDFAVRIPGFVNPGTVIPERFSRQDVPVCDLPTEEVMWEMVGDKLGAALGNFVARSYTIDRVLLMESRMVAVLGNFNELVSVALVFKPKMIDGVVRPPFDLGAVASASGLGTEIVLTPPVPVDLMQIMREQEMPPLDECALVGAEVHGVVPLNDVSADVIVRVRVTVTAKNLFASIGAWFAQLFL